MSSSETGYSTRAEPPDDQHAADTEPTVRAGEHTAAAARAGIRSAEKEFSRATAQAEHVTGT